MLRKGDTGPLVREVQGNLRRLGAGIPVDGIFGPRTDQAVRAFQKSKHLNPDGIVGPATLRALHGVSPNARQVPGHDEFDPGEYMRWLGRLPGMVYDAVVPDWLSGGGKPTARPAAGPSSKPAPTPARPAAPKGMPIVSPSQNKKHSRISFPGYKGRGFVVRDFERYRDHQIRLVGGVTIQRYQKGSSLKNECAQFVQFFGVPQTRFWRRGPQVCYLDPGSLPVGTVVATLRDGIYHNDYSGRSHVGVYLGHDAHGNAKGKLTIMDQYNGAPIARRDKYYAVDANEHGRATRAWTDAAGHLQTHRVSWGKDGEEYFVLLTEA